MRVWRGGHDLDTWGADRPVRGMRQDMGAIEDDSDLVVHRLGLESLVAADFHNGTAP